MLCIRYVEGAQSDGIDPHVLGGDLRTAMLLGILEMAKDHVLNPE